MPELPEVEVVVRTLRELLTGREIVRVTRCHPDVYLVAPGLVPDWPRRVSTVRRRGKYILIELAGRRVLVVHLRMTGRLSVEAAGRELQPHTHVRFHLDGGDELRFVDPRRFGRVRLESDASLARSPDLGALGPEPLAVGVEEFRSRLERSRASLKAALLDQRRIAGIGNIYADEILFDCGLHPAQPANTLLEREWEPLLASVQRILGSAIERGGSTIRDYRSADGRPGSYQDDHRVFGRTGEACGRCGGTIRKIRIVGRGTHFCPGCQRRRRRRPVRPTSRGKTSQ